MGANFVGQNRVRSPDSSLVCEACVTVMSGKPPDTLRMQSHLVDDRGWNQWNKGQKLEMRAWLRGPKKGEWFAAIADSGKKHVIPWTPINGEASRPGRVLFEERLVTLDDWTLVDEMTELLTMGATKEELLSGALGARAWQLCGAQLRIFEKRRSGSRGGGWFELALWLAQRDELKVKEREDAERERERKSKDVRGRTPARNAGRVPADSGGKRAKKLGLPNISHAECSKDIEQRGGVGDGHGEGPQNRGAQCELFAGLDSASRSSSRKRGGK